MPKLDATHILDRLTKRLEDLNAGELVAKREVEALLTHEQVAAMDTAWSVQKAGRVGKKPKTPAQQLAVGWKEIRDIQIEAYESAIKAAWAGIEDEMQTLQQVASTKQARIYMDSLQQSMAQGKDKRVAENWANNQLTRAGLNRTDGVGVNSMSKRDAQVRTMEAAILGRLTSEMTADELEQLELLKQHDKAVGKDKEKRR